MIKPNPQRPDWFFWPNPDPGWCLVNGMVPGISRTPLALNLHITHWPLLPDRERDEMASSLNRSSIAPPTDALRPYQAADYQFLQPRSGALLAYEMRMGKSPLAAHLHDPARGNLIVVGPLAAREAWREWIDRTWGIPPMMLAGRTNVEPAPGYKAYFCHYDVLGAHTHYLGAQPIGTLVLDEVHLLAKRHTKRLSAVNVLAPRAKRVLALSGTPMWNKPISMYTLLHLINPGAWGTHFEFAQAYCGAEPGNYGYVYDGISNAEELNARLAMIMCRRTWAETIADLPPTTRVLEPVELTGNQLAALEAAAMKVTLAGDFKDMNAGYLSTLRRQLASAKVGPAVEAALRAAGDGHKVVLWTWHKAVGEKVVQELGSEYPVWHLRAEDSFRCRDEYVQAFRNEPGPGFLVANMAIAGVGIDLSCSDYAIFVELDWTPAVVYQAEMRTFHISRPHCVVYFYTDDPVESQLIEALDVKNQFASAIGVGTGDIIKRVLHATR
jgi:SWI/SNF-related matrix-associated actin-dependent regulator 1 of chromatin subfamily A